jgi:hypothetical protein
MWMNQCVAFVRCLADAPEVQNAAYGLGDAGMCGKCHSEVAIRPGSDPTRFCDECAQEMLEEAIMAAQRLIGEIDKGSGKRQE